MRLPDMADLARVIKGAVAALGCLVFAMLLFGGMIAFADYSIAQADNQRGAAEGTTLAVVMMLVAFVGGSAILIWAVRGLIWAIRGGLKRTTIAGPLVVRSDDRSLYVRVPFSGDTDLYQLGRLPAGYMSTPTGIDGPGGVRFGIGQAITVSGTVSRSPGDAGGVGVPIFDATDVR